MPYSNEEKRKANAEIDQIVKALGLKVGRVKLA